MKSQKKVFVSGGHGDIGQAIVAHFAEAGHEVRAPRSQELDLKKLPSIADYFQGHPFDAEIFIHCAGINIPKPWEQQTQEDMAQTLAVNLSSFLELAKVFVPRMKNRNWGRVLAISSIYGSFGREGRLPYVVSKHGLNGAVKTLAIEWGRHGVLINSLSPGFIDTKLTRKNNSEETIRSFERKIPIGRLGKVEEIAEFALFLCSEKNSFIHGQDLVIDGGYSVGGFQA